MRDRPINGELETYKFEGLLENVKNRGCSLFTTLSYNDELYDFTIHAVKLVTAINENTKWYFTVHKWDDNEDVWVADLSDLYTKEGFLENLKIKNQMIKKLKFLLIKVVFIWL